MAARRARLGLALGLVATLLAPAGALAADPPTPAPSPTSAAGATAANTAAPGRVLVRFKPSATPASRRLALTTAGATADGIKGLATGSDDLAPHLVPGLEAVETDLPVDVAVARLNAQPGVDIAEPDQVITAALTPNDPNLPDEWGLDQPNDADIDAKAAWDTTTGSPDVTVAVIDSGIALDHPDLAANIWTNPGEIAGNGIDDDHDGYIDDVHGWDFVDDDNLPDDQFGHGTHVSGTVAAVGNNGIGVVGVAYTSKVMPLRILDANGAGYVSDAIRALDFAARHGVRISNNSWGYVGAASQVLSDAIQAAGDAGQLVVVAAGNQGNDIDQIPNYPGAYDLPNIISVAATDEDDQLAQFSNVGALGVDIAAPGDVILSTEPSGYGYSSGTSMASPHVAGVAALVLSLHPTWTVAQIRDRILQTARPLKALEGVIATGGIVNAAAAVGGAGVVNLAPVVKITSPASGTSVLRGSKVTLTATAVDPEQGNVASSISWVSSLQGAIGSGPSITRSDLAEGTHVIVAIAHDAGHNTPLAAIQLRIGPEVHTIEGRADPRTPAIAVSPGGTPVLTWTEQGIGTIVSRPAAGSWSHEVVAHGANDRWPDPIVDADGTVRVAIQREWSNPGAVSDGGIIVATDDGSGAGTGWTDARISEGCGDDALGCGVDWTPSIALAGTGREQLAWSRTPVAGATVPGNGPGLWHAAEHANGSWTSELAVAAPDGVSDPDLAIGPDGSAHVAYARYDDGHEGVYEATDESGSWVETRIVPLAAGTRLGWTRIAVSADDQVDVAWGSADGVVVATRTTGAWGAPATVTTDRAGDVDLVRHGSTLQMVIGLVDATQLSSGIAYATATDGGSWTVTDLDTGQDVQPRIAVDAAGHAHVSYLRGWPEHEVRYATDSTGAWATQVVETGFIWTQPAFGVDASGVHHVAVGRYGDQPGVWYGTDKGGHWTLERLSQHQPDGPVSLAVGPDGTASIAYAEYFDDTSTPLPDRAVRVITGKPGSWTTTRIADDTGGASPSIARDSAGHLHLAYGTATGGPAHIAYATNATGSWVIRAATPGAIGDTDRNPSIGVDASGKVHIAFEQVQPGEGIFPYGAVSLGYATNRTGAWVSTVVSSGNEYRFEPSLAVDPAGHPRIAYWLDSGGGSHGSLTGVRVASFNGTSWANTTVSTSSSDIGPSLAIDAAGASHVLYSRNVGYSVCSIPLCSSAPGLRYWSSASGFGTPRRVTDNVDDAYPVIVRGLDGSIAGAFADVDWRLAEIRLVGPAPIASAPVTHLAGAGTSLSAGKATLSIGLAGSGAKTFRLQQSVNGAAYATVGSVSGSTTRVLTVSPSLSTTRRLRVIPYDRDGRAGSATTGATFRVSVKSEVATSTLTYAGSWSTVRSSSYFGGKVRRATSSSAKATYRFTGREVTWITAKGASRGKARVYIDGVLVSTVNLRTPSTHYRRVVFRRAWSASGAHTITIRPVGNGRVDIDGFEVLR